MTMTKKQLIAVFSAMILTSALVSAANVWWYLVGKAISRASQRRLLGGGFATRLFN